MTPVSLDRMVNAVERVRDRLRRAVAALESAGVPYAVAGGNAVAAWVSRVDEAAVRNTQDVDILLRRDDLDAAKKALEAAGFVYRHVKSIDRFLDGPDAKARDAGTVALRDRLDGDLGACTVDEAIERLTEEVAAKRVRQVAEATAADLSAKAVGNEY